MSNGAHLADHRAARLRENHLDPQRSASPLRPLGLSALAGHLSEELQQSGNLEIDKSWLNNQIPDVQYGGVRSVLEEKSQKDQLTLIEWPQFIPPQTSGIERIDL